MPFELAQLFEPMPLDTFRRGYWEQRSIRIARQRPGQYDKLFTLRDFDALIAQTRIRDGDIRILSNGRETQIRELRDPGYNGEVGVLEHVYAQFRSGRSIALNGLSQCTAPLRRMCRALARGLSARVQVNAYLSPAGEGALRAHYDTHDVLVLQIWGSKHWRLFDGGFPLALPQYPYRRGSSPGRTAEEFDLEPGDLLYVPRGIVHSATARESASLHLTVGIQAIPWATVLAGVLASEVKRDRRLRASLPPCFDSDPAQRQAAVSRLKELLQSLAGRIDLEAVIDDAAQAARRGTPPALEGHLEDLVALDHIDRRTPFQRRADVDCHVIEDKRGLGLQFHGKEVRLPARMAPAVRRILAKRRFNADTLGGDLEENERLGLLRCLVREGLLTTR